MSNTADSWEAGILVRLRVDVCCLLDNHVKKSLSLNLFFLIHCTMTWFLFQVMVFYLIMLDNANDKSPRDGLKKITVITPPTELRQPKSSRHDHVT